MKNLLLFLFFFSFFVISFTSAVSIHAQNVGQKCTGALTNDPNGRCGPAATGVIDGICTGTLGIQSNCVVNRQPDGGLCGTDNSFCKNGYCDKTGKCATPPGTVCTGDSGAKGFCEVGYCGTWGTSINRSEYPDGTGTCNQTFGGWGPNNPVNTNSCCIPKKADNVACKNNDQCASGNCDGGICKAATSSGISLPGTIPGTRSCLGKYGESGTCGDTYGWTAASVGWSCPTGMVDGESTNTSACGMTVPCCIIAASKITPTPGPSRGLTLPTLPVGSIGIPAIPGLTFTNPVTVGGGTTAQSCTGSKGTGTCAQNYCDSITGLCGGICGSGEINALDSSNACGQFVSCCMAPTTSGPASSGFCQNTSTNETGMCATNLAQQIYGTISVQNAQAISTGKCPTGYHNTNADSKWCGYGKQCCVMDDPNTQSNATKLCMGANKEPGTCAPSVGIGNIKAGLCWPGTVNVGKDNFDQQSCGLAVQCCGKKVNAPAATPTPQKGSTPGSGGSSSGGGGSSGGSSNSGGGSNNGGGGQSCPRSNDTCTYSQKESDGSVKCYSGSGADGFNKPGCRYSCGPVPCPVSEKQRPSKKALDCTPGDPIDAFDDIDCPKGKSGTCGGHSYCVYDEAGNYESDPICETEKETCSEKNSGSGGNTNSSCKDNPTAPPDGYTWKNSCKSCSNNDDCPKNSGDGAVNPETSNWCFGGSCLMLITGDSPSSSNSRNTNRNDDDDDDDEDNEDEDDGITKDDTGNRTKQNNEKSARDIAQKPIDKINKDRKNQGLPTLTPLPPDWTPNSVPSPTPSPTPLPPLPEPTNWQSICGQTTDPTRPWGIRVSWDPVPGAPRYAVRIDEKVNKDTPSWAGDIPNVGDTVDNQVQETAYARQAQPGFYYEWWVHSVNASGVYSGLTKKVIVECPKPTTSGTPAPQGVGAGQLIVLPPITTTPQTVVLPTATPTPKP